MGLLRWLRDKRKRSDAKTATLASVESYADAAADAAEKTPPGDELVGEARSHVHDHSHLVG
jgi:hypothetical protein